MGLINFQAYDKLSQKEIDSKINSLAQRGFSFDLPEKTGPLIVTDDNHVLQTAQLKSPDVCIEFPATIKYGVSYIKMSAQNVVDYFEDYNAPDRFEPKIRAVHFRTEDLADLLDLICLGLSQDKKIMAVGGPNKDSEKYPITTLRKLEVEANPSVFDHSVTDADLGRAIVRGLEYSSYLHK